MGDSNFLDDLEGLGEDSDKEEEEDEFGDEGNGKRPGGGLGGGVKAEDLDSLDSSDEEGAEAMDEVGGCVPVYTRAYIPESTPTTNPTTPPTQDGNGGAGKNKKRKAPKGEEAEEDDLDRALKRVKGDTLAAVATLSRSRRYQEHVTVRN